MLILNIPLYVVDVHMPIGLYSSIVYRYAIVIWLYKKMQTRNQHSVQCLHKRRNRVTVRRVLQTTDWVQSELGHASFRICKCTW